MNRTEELLREALRDEAGDTTSAPDAWDGIVAAGIGRSRGRNLRWSAAAVAAVAGVSALAALGVVLTDEDDAGQRVGTEGPATTTETTGDAVTTTAPDPGNERPEQAFVISVGNRLSQFNTAAGQTERPLYDREVDEATGAGRLGGLSLAPDGTVWFSMAGAPGDCASFGVYRHTIDTVGPEQVAVGAAPAVSPDGRLLAYAAYSGAHGGPDGEFYGCANTLVVRDLVSGAERVWLPAVDGYQELAAITRISWAPDSRRLIYDLNYEGSSVALLDTEVPGGLGQASMPLATGDVEVESLRSPVWLAGSDEVVVLAGEGTLLRVNVATEAVAEVARSMASYGLDADATGRHLLLTETDGTLVAVAPDGNTEVLAEGFAEAVW